MELIFDIVSYHRLSPEQNSKKSISNTLTFGRSENNDWHLPDPEKVVSGFHARVEKLADGFYIYDLSTNGLYINRSVEALGKSNSHKLCEDDLLTFGDYEVSVSFIHNSIPNADVVITSNHTASTNSASTNKASINSAGSSHKPITAIDNKTVINTSVQGISPSTLFGEHPFASNNSRKMPLVSNDLNDHFDVPQAIPEEWDTKFLKNKTTTNSPFIENKAKPIIEPPVPALQKEAVPVPKSVQHHEIKQDINTPSLTDNTNFNAFIKGLGISTALNDEQFNDELLFEMGQSMQLMLMGLVESLRTRSALKSEFRINQTTFQQQENNPLKFSATIDDVFHNLFLKRSASFLPSTKAITEAFNDTKKHDIALAAGTLGAIEGIFKQLAPIEIEKKDLKESVFDQLLPGQKQLRYWKTYQSLHKDMVNEITANGSSALSDDFVRAYDKKIKSL